MAVSFCHSTAFDKRIEYYIVGLVLKQAHSKEQSWMKPRSAPNDLTLFFVAHNKENDNA